MDQPADPAANPYTPKSSTLFYGRAALMREVLAKEQSGQSVVLLGGRRCGKTTVLRRVRDLLVGLAADAHLLGALWRRLVDADTATQHGLPDVIGIGMHWPVMVSFMGVQPGTLAGALDLIAAGLSASLPALTAAAPDRAWAQGLELDQTINELLAARPHPADVDTLVLEQWLMQVDRLLADLGLGGIALLIDEIETIFDRPWCHELMAALRRFDDTSLRERIWIMLVGADGLDRYRSPSDGSPPLNTLSPMVLDDLGYRERWHMAVGPFAERQRLPPDDGVLQRLDALAGGNVRLLTLMLERLFDRTEPGVAGRPAAPPLTPTCVDEIGEEVIEAQIQTFQRWGRALDLGPEGVAWALYGKLCDQGILDSSYFRTDPQKAARRLFRYQALGHQRADRRIEIGPGLFRRWASDNGHLDGPADRPPHREPEGESSPPGRYRYDVAISFAGPERALAKRLADLLCHQVHLRVFYDTDQGQDLLSVNLDRHLPTVYGRDCRVAVLLLSQAYLTRYWPQVECRAALTRAIVDGWNGVLMVSADGSRLPDVPGSIVLRDLTREDSTLEGLALELSGLLLAERRPQ